MTQIARILLRISAIPEPQDGNQPTSDNPLRSLLFTVEVITYYCLSNNRSSAWPARSKPQFAQGGVSQHLTQTIWYYTCTCTVRLGDSGPSSGGKRWRVCVRWGMCVG